jgi:hypothetical protein
MRSRILWGEMLCASWMRLTLWQSRSRIKFLLQRSGRRDRICLLSGEVRGMHTIPMPSGPHKRSSSRRTMSCRKLPLYAQGKSAQKEALQVHFIFSSSNLIATQLHASHTPFIHERTHPWPHVLTLRSVGHDGVEVCYLLLQSSCNNASILITSVSRPVESRSLCELSTHGATIRIAAKRQPRANSTCANFDRG